MDAVELAREGMRVGEMTRERRDEDQDPVRLGECEALLGHRDQEPHLTSTKVHGRQTSIGVHAVQGAALEVGQPNGFTGKLDTPIEFSALGMRGGRDRPQQDRGRRRQAEVIGRALPGEGREVPGEQLLGQSPVSRGAVDPAEVKADHDVQPEVAEGLGDGERLVAGV